MCVPIPVDEKRASTIRDVARLAGVSTMTVSRVINGGKVVGEESRVRVRKAIDALDYSPNRAARKLARGEDATIALMCSTPSFSYLSEFLIGCLDQAGKSDVQLLVERCDGDWDRTAAIQRLVRSGVNAVILMPPLCDDDSLLDELASRGVATVLVAPKSLSATMPTIMIDDRRAAYDMTRHLLRLGHRHIGFIKGDPRHDSTHRRYQGFVDAMRKDDVPIDLAVIAQGQFNYRSGFEAAMGIFQSSSIPSAIFASNDDMAAGVIAAAHGRGLDIPNDISVCGFDDSPLASAIWPPLTTVRQPIDGMARKAVELLLHLIREKREDGSPEQPHIPMDCMLVRRLSDAAPKQRPSLRATA